MLMADMEETGLKHFPVTLDLLAQAHWTAWLSLDLVQGEVSSSVAAYSLLQLLQARLNYVEAMVNFLVRLRWSLHFSGTTPLDTGLKLASLIVAATVLVWMRLPLTSTELLKKKLNGYNYPVTLQSEKFSNLATKHLIVIDKENSVNTSGQ